LQLSSARASPIPEHIRNTPFNSHAAPQSAYHLRLSQRFEQPRTAPISASSSWHTPAPAVTIRNSINSHIQRPSSRLSESSFGNEIEGEDDERDEEDNTYDHTIRRPLPSLPHTASVSRPPSVMRPPMYAIATPPPTLMFAIASDDVSQVRYVLENGGTGPNDSVGPQSALAFALTNDQLANKMDIVKTLLAYGADPTVLKTYPKTSPQSDSDVKTSPMSTFLMDDVDPATR
jgi:hypothetical protein